MASGIRRSTFGIRLPQRRLLLLLSGLNLLIAVSSGALAAMPAGPVASAAWRERLPQAPPSAPATTEEEDPQLALVEAIRGDQPERVFDLLAQTGPAVPSGRKLCLQALAYYRIGDFEAVLGLLQKTDEGSPDALLLRSLLQAAEGRFQEAEKLVSQALSRRDELGLLAFEAGLLRSYLLQHLDRPEDAATVIDQLLPIAPFGRPALRSIKKSLEVAPGEPYRMEAMAPEHVIPLLADGSLPTRTVLSLHPDQPGQLVLFDTGTSLTLLKADVQHDLETGATALALDLDSNPEFQYGWQKNLTVGGWHIENIPVGFVDRKSEQAVNLNYEAIFGLPFMQRFFVVFHFPKRSMQLLEGPPERIEGDAVPFLYVADQVIIRATVNGKPANLLIDTGLALPSLKLDTSWGMAVATPPAGSDLPTGQPAPLTAAPGKQPTTPTPSQAPMPAMETQVRSLKFGSQEMKDLPVTLDPLRRRMKLNPLAVRIDGILAAPLMKDYIVSIDFRNNRIYFQKSTH